MNERSSYTPPEVARRLRVKPSKVLGWIRRGELRAINVAERQGGRPRWRVLAEDLAAFEAARGAQPQVRVPRRRRGDADVRVKYF